MFMSRVRILAALIAAASIAPAVQAAPAAEETQQEKLDSASEFAKSLIDEASSTLSNESLSEAQRMTHFREFLGDKMDLNFISRIVLAKRFRGEMNEEQLARYDAVFPKYMTRIYASQFNKIFGRPYTFSGSNPASRGDTFVSTDFDRSEGKSLNVVWRIRSDEGDNRIVDIIVQGGSIITTKREEFSSFIESNGVEAFLERLEKEAAAA